MRKHATVISILFIVMLLASCRGSSFTSPKAAEALATESPSPTMTSVAQHTGVDFPTCDKESTTLSPQGEWLSDGRFDAKDVVAPAGFSYVIFDGQVNKSGEHVFLVFGKRVDHLRYVQGTWYAVCSADLLAVAKRIAHEKENRNPGLKISVIDMRNGENLVLTIN